MAYQERSPEERNSRMTSAERRAGENEVEGSRSAQKALGRKLIKKTREQRKSSR